MAGVMDVMRGTEHGMARLVHEYTIPSTIENPFRKIGLIELRASEQILMSRMVSEDATTEEQMTALVKACIYTVDGVKPNKVSIEFENMWEAVHPKVRNLLRRAVNKIFVPAPKEDEDFFLSASVRTEG